MSDEIKQAIDSLRRHPDFKVYPEFKWSAAQIDTFEQRTGLTVSSQLAEVLTSYGEVGCSEQELYFLASFSDGEEVEGEIQFLVNKFDQVMDFQKTFGPDDDHAGRIDRKYIFFGTADGGNRFLLADGTRDDSPIYFWPLAFDPLGEGDNARGVAVAAGSLAEFIRGLRKMDEM